MEEQSSSSEDEKSQKRFYRPPIGLISLSFLAGSLLAKELEIGIAGQLLIPLGFCLIIALIDDLLAHAGIHLAIRVGIWTIAWLIPYRAQAVYEKWGNTVLGRIIVTTNVILLFSAAYLVTKVLVLLWQKMPPVVRRYAEHLPTNLQEKLDDPNGQS